MTMMENSHDDPHLMADPSMRAIQMVLRESLASKELTEAKIKEITAGYDAKFNAMDAAVKLLAEYPTEVDKAIKAVREYYDALLKGTEQRFHDRDARADDWKKSSKEALDAALTAHKEAVGKSEKHFADQIKSMDEKTSVEISSLQRELSNLKERLAAVEHERSGGRQTWGYIALGVGVLSALAGMAFGVIAAVSE